MWVDASVVAEHLDRSQKTVLRLARSGGIPAVKVGRSWRFSLDDIDAHLRKPVDVWAQSPQSRGRKRAA